MEDGPDLNLFRPSRLQGRPSREEASLDPGEYASDEDVRESGAGILEFTPAKAGLDMTPANYDFETKDEKKRNATGLSNFAGELCIRVLCEKGLKIDTDGNAMVLYHP